MPARKRCTLSSRGVVSGWPRYICSAPPERAMAVNRNKQTWTMRWLVGIGVFVGIRASSTFQADVLKSVLRLLLASGRIAVRAVWCQSLLPAHEQRKTSARRAGIGRHTQLDDGLGLFDLD